MDQIGKKILHLSAQEFLQRGELDPMACDRICEGARKILLRLMSKFSRVRIFDEGLLKEFDRIMANAEAIFIKHRLSRHLARLAYSTYLIRKKISKHLTLLPFKDHFDICLFPSLLRFMFGKKPVLSVLIHVHLSDRYVVFDEEQALLIIQKVCPEAHLVKDSTYTLQPPKSKVKTLYFEVSQSSGAAFTSDEIKQIRYLLRQEFRLCIEQLVHPIFMVRNEEEIIKNILTLSQEIVSVKDNPEVMILLDQQTASDVIFTVTVVRVVKPGSPCVNLSIPISPDVGVYTQDRCQVVRYLRKTYPIEAHVFRIKLRKNPSFFRTDKTLNFYRARHKITQILEHAIGKFRDYNGGIIIRQREALADLMENFSGLSLKELDLLETFYYSLSPIEAQAILSNEVLRRLFELFLEAKKVHFTKPSDFVFKFQDYHRQLLVLVRIPDKSFQFQLDAIVSSFALSEQPVTYTICEQNTYFLGYLIASTDFKFQFPILDAIHQSLNQWKNRIESRQILKLSLGSPVLSLDPRIGGDQISVVMLQLLFEGLMRINRKGELDYAVAQSVDISGDQRTYLFKLRPTFWSDGSSVTAYDFEYAWKKVLSPPFKTPFAYLFYPIKHARLAKKGAISSDDIGVKALDRLTLKVDLEFPAPYFLELTAHTIYSPVNRLIDQKHPNWAFEDTRGYVCNGAFQLKKNELHSSEEYELIKNPLYWDKQNIQLDEIKISKGHRYQAYELFQKDANHWVGSPLVTWEPTFFFER